MVQIMPVHWRKPNKTFDINKKTHSPNPQPTLLISGGTIRQRSVNSEIATLLRLQAFSSISCKNLHTSLGSSSLICTASSFGLRTPCLATLLTLAAINHGSSGSAILPIAFGCNFSSIMCSLSTKSSLNVAIPEDMSFLTQDEATKIDVELFDEYGFTIDQLMELAGLAVATAIAKAYPPNAVQGGSGNVDKSSPSAPKVLICAGPGNNGGDGLVAARHLKWFGYDPCIFYPKQPAKPLFAALRRQCEEMEISFMSFLPDATLVDQNFALVVDALFGFGFRPPVRPEFVEVLQKLCKFKTPIVSVDVPSGWDVEMGPHADSIKPAMVVSLTAPKKCVQNYKGKHFLGGRFIPNSLAAKYKLRLPTYVGTELVIRLQ
ncbi:NAD(P)H-hydrate epimerase-like isoform X2 [Varroa destructor]|nr:NAD(P)H-hydrate epimerase-like isoform X2 [Varroa destructor]XP_022659685.1 NAD(P)H-hydrate epimerase-like isoform X2 [Varroa destructor]